MKVVIDLIWTSFVLKEVRGRVYSLFLLMQLSCELSRFTEIHLHSLTLVNDRPLPNLHVWHLSRWTLALQGGPSIRLCEYLLGSVVKSGKLPSAPVVVFYHVASHGKFQSFSGLAGTTCSLTPVSIYKPYAVVTAENLCRHNVISHKYFINSVSCTST